MDDIIKLERLTKFYGKNRGIEDVSLEVRRGEIFGYLGPNGAGKTTTIRLLLDLIRADRGEARVFGLDVRRDSRAIRSRLGFLPGELFLYDKLSGEELLRFYARIRNGSGPDNVRALAERLQCDLSRPIRTLSQGNKRKLGLIQALMHEPDLLMLDEPSNGLDPLVQHELYGLLEEARQRGQTVFLSSHNLPEVERICQRVAIIRSGRIAALEAVNDFKRRSLREVEVRFATAVDAARLAAVKNFFLQESHPLMVRGRVTGDMGPLLEALARLPVRDLLSREPSLEDIFLAYYGNHG